MDELLEEMIDPAPSRQDVARRRRVWATGSILVLAAVGVTSLTTSALFTDQDTLSDSLTTGTVVLTAEGAQFTLPAEGLAPGDVALAPLTVRNEGSLALRYAVSTSAATATPATGTPGTGDLRTQLRVRVYADATCTQASTDAGTALGDTRTLLPGDFGLPGDLTPIVGDPATGAQPGDRGLDAVVRSEVLCLRVDMSRDADDTFQNTAAELTFRLDSEQTVNN
ncbi:TasA family protein [Cellulomonas phragmiteti]